MRIVRRYDKVVGANPLDGFDRRPLPHRTRRARRRSSCLPSPASAKSRRVLPIGLIQVARPQIQRLHQMKIAIHNQKSRHVTWFTSSSRLLPKDLIGKSSALVSRITFYAPFCRAVSTGYRQPPASVRWRSRGRTSRRAAPANAKSSNAGKYRRAVAFRRARPNARRESK